MEDENKEADVIPIESAKKEVPEELEPPREKTTRELGMNDEQRVAWWNAIFWKLTEHPRFIKFIQDNFVIGAHLDEEKKQAMPIITEKENVPLPISADQIFKIGAACMRHGARDSTALTKQVLGILGHKEQPRILAGNEQELNKVLAEQDAMKKRLDP